MALLGLEKIISGGQTGVDRAGLDVALELKIPIGGYIPKGRWAADGSLHKDYKNMVETATDAPEERTRLNVMLGDATLILTMGKLDPGTQLTAEIASTLEKPCLELNLHETLRADGLQVAIAKSQAFISRNEVKVLNIAGPREENVPKIHDRAADFLRAVLTSPVPSNMSSVTYVERIQHLDQALASIRHWDTVRWLVPFWFLSASGAVASKIYDIERFVAIIAGLGMFVAGLACFHLVSRTIHYNNDQISRLKAIGAPIAAHGIAAISFKWRGLRTPATLFFQSITAAVTLAWIGFAIVQALPPISIADLCLLKLCSE